MVNPHAHHVLFKLGNGPAQKALVQEGQELLRKVGIDPIFGKEVLFWAPNKKGLHVKAMLQNLIDEIEFFKKGLDLICFSGKWHTSMVFKRWFQRLLVLRFFDESVSFLLCAYAELGVISIRQTHPLRLGCHDKISRAV